MSRYRMYPSRDQERMLLAHCGNARYVWNLAVEQHRWWRPGRKAAPGYLVQDRQLTEARAEHPWLAEGARIVQREALRDFDRAMQAFYKGIRGRPSWRKAGRNEGFGFAKGTADKPGQNVRAKAGLNRGILSSGWGMLARRLKDKAPGRVEKVPSAYTSQRCSVCGHVAAENRKSQADFACTACGFACNADVNAARNIAAGRAVTARGGHQATGPVNREPHLLLHPV